MNHLSCSKGIKMKIKGTQLKRKKTKTQSKRILLEFSYFRDDYASE